MPYPENVVMNFGKYKGKSLGEILADDPSYLDFLADADIHTAGIRRAVDLMCEKYEAEISKAIGED